MTDIKFQFFAPAWWKLWPTWYVYDDAIAGEPYSVVTFCIGPFQWEWYK